MRIIMKAVKFGLLLALIASAPAFAESTVSLGYAHAKFEDVKLKGFNAQYRYEWNSPLSVVVSASHLGGDEKFESGKADIKYTSLLVGPAYRFNDLVSIYGLSGFAKSTLEGNGPGYHHKESKSSFAYGGGIQLNPTKNLAVNLGYENTKVFNETFKGFNIGVGYRF